MCHFNFPNIPQQISIFKNLKLLTIVAQDLSEVGKNLDELICLEKLWICETRISVMEGFNNLVNLKELYLYGNKITKIQNLENNVDLEILSLSDNQIKNIENLQTLVKLKIFQCGNNLISKIGHSFDKNVEIRELMLSGNLISNFREIIQLVHLPNLKSLSLSNPNFRENPISSLFNYQTHVILHLPQLKYLDTLEITEESRKMIGATVLKKIM
ncbi:Leucine-rich repeat-containing protein 9 [Lobulomyces angularis]|nr:Leucine-rich repeat-containing protein 9 [Lobulomyces angularis]